MFGSIAYSHVPNEMKGKLDDKSKKCILVGYNENSKAYRLYNPISKKIIISRDVHFNEEESWKWNVAEQKHKSISNKKLNQKVSSHSQPPVHQAMKIQLCHH